MYAVTFVLLYTSYVRYYIYAAQLGRLSRLSLTAILKSDFIGAPLWVGLDSTRNITAPLFTYFSRRSNLARWFQRKRYVNDTVGGC